MMDQVSEHLYGLSGQSMHELIHKFPLDQTDIRENIDNILQEYKDVPGGLMVILNEIQSQIGYISRPIQEYVSLVLNTPVSTIAGVVSFYSFFTTEPRGDHTVKFCMGTACYVGGTQQLIRKAEQILNIQSGETTPDNRITLEVCRCVGSCSQAPVVVVDEQMYGRLRPSKIPPLIRDILKKYEDS
ncbi:MAG: NAD(P)H-dependent oxidoreductase subunit E [Anaerolineaceae bacterium]|nr:NAD(P)H-dependent oxidoreductase subunit E [Anaerolineaceae bacterium]